MRRRNSPTRVTPGSRSSNSQCGSCERVEELRLQLLRVHDHGAELDRPGTVCRRGRRDVAGKAPALASPVSPRSRSRPPQERASPAQQRAPTTSIAALEHSRRAVMTGGSRPSTVMPSMSSTSIDGPRPSKSWGRYADLDAHLVADCGSPPSTASRSMPTARRGRPGRRVARASAPADRPASALPNTGRSRASASARECERNPTGARWYSGCAVILRTSRSRSMSSPTRSTRSGPRRLAVARRAVTRSNGTSANAVAGTSRWPARGSRTRSTPVRALHNDSEPTSNGMEHARHLVDRRWGDAPHVPVVETVELEDHGEGQRHRNEPQHPFRLDVGHRGADRQGQEHRDDVGNAEEAPVDAVANGIAVGDDAARLSRPYCASGSARKLAASAANAPAIGSTDESRLRSAGRRRRSASRSLTVATVRP